jgi:Na+/H+ antiporter NhaD/arsenite permease-like protein
MGSGGGAAESLASELGSAAHAAGQAVPGSAWCLPFVLLLATIAVFPLVPRVHHWWERNVSKLVVALALGAAVLGHYATRGFGFHGAGAGAESVTAVLRHALIDDYVPFLTLLLSLYVIAGGVELKGDLLALPRVNLGFLALGASLASVVGTTGASMVLIRPLLKTNAERRFVVHTVVFFIFLVSNIGGSLLPLGDPPLFLGYLKGVPFFWTATLAGPWAFCVGALLGIYYLIERFVMFPREAPAQERIERLAYEPLRVRGAVNFLWLAGVIAAVAGMVPGQVLPGTGWTVTPHAREVVLLVLAGLSLLTTPRGLRRENLFGYGAIIEVAVLFLGIFLTMQVPIEILQAHGPRLGLSEPAHFFWGTGMLSSFLDNAPTYLVFFETARTQPMEAGAGLVHLAGEGQIAEPLLRAISLGAVFMGANTYIGNGPNFLVKSIAESQGVKMPGFFGYMLWSGAILVPLFVVVQRLFVGS